MDGELLQPQSHSSQFISISCLPPSRFSPLLCSDFILSPPPLFMHGDRRASTFTDYSQDLHCYDRTWHRWVKIQFLHHMINPASPILSHTHIRHVLAALRSVRTNVAQSQDTGQAALSIKLARKQRDSVVYAHGGWTDFVCVTMKCLFLALTYIKSLCPEQQHPSLRKAPQRRECDHSNPGCGQTANSNAIKRRD